MTNNRALALSLPYRIIAALLLLAGLILYSLAFPHGYASAVLPEAALYAGIVLSLLGAGATAYSIGLSGRNTLLAAFFPVAFLVLFLPPLFRAVLMPGHAEPDLLSLIRIYYYVSLIAGFFYLHGDRARTRGPSEARYAGERRLLGANLFMILLFLSVILRIGMTIYKAMFGGA